MWNLVLSDIKYYKNYYLTAVSISFFLLLIVLLDSGGVFNLNIKDALLSILNVPIFICSYIFMVVLYNQKEYRERITALLPLSVTERKRSRYIIYLLGLSFNVFILTLGVIFISDEQILSAFSFGFSQSMILTAGFFIVIEFLQIKLFKNKLVNTIFGAIIISVVFGVNLVMKKYFFPMFEINILYMENLLAVTWAIIIMFIAGICFSKRVSFLDNK